MSYKKVKQYYQQLFRKQELQRQFWQLRDELDAGADEQVYLEKQLKEVRHEVIAEAARTGQIEDEYEDWKYAQLKHDAIF